MPGQEGGDPAGIVDAESLSQITSSPTRAATGAGGSRRRPTPPHGAAPQRGGGPNDGHHPVILGVTRSSSLGRRQTATCRTRRSSVRRLGFGRPRYRHSRGTVHGPGRAGSAAIRSPGRRPPSRSRPRRGRSAGPATPSSRSRNGAQSWWSPGESELHLGLHAVGARCGTGFAQLARYSNRAVLHIPASPRRTSTRLCPYGRSSRADPASRARWSDHVSPVRDHFCAQSPPTPSERLVKSASYRVTEVGWVVPPCRSCCGWSRRRCNATSCGRGCRPGRVPWHTRLRPECVR